MTSRDADSGSRAAIRWISGPVLRARTEGPFLLREAIRVGPAGLLGEVIRLNEDEIVAQVYEDTTGLRPGVEVRGTGNLLGIRVGPGLLGNIYDGLLRPLRPADALRFRFDPTVQAGARLDRRRAVRRRAVAARTPAARAAAAERRRARCVDRGRGRSDRRRHGAAHRVAKAAQRTRSRSATSGRCARRARCVPA